jgi:predicted deacetylase
VGIRARTALPRRAGARTRRIAVSLHDVEPATFSRCALIRDWLEDHGVDRVTLLVIPARDLHPLAERSPELCAWLAERRAAGDAIAQHGFRHERLERAALIGRGAFARRDRGHTPEFIGMSAGEARRAVDAGWRVLKLAGLEPDGFVAPGYAYTRALRLTLPRRFRWWADRLHLYSPQARPPGVLELPHERSGVGLRARSPTWGASSEDYLRRAISPLLVRAGALLRTHTLRLEVHPGDLDHPRHMLALEWLLRRAGQRREAITYEDLLPLSGQLGEPVRSAGANPLIEALGELGNPPFGAAFPALPADSVD